ncbi:MAG: hypothetical protein ACRCY4_04190 [Brevinema sp.]
MRYFLSLSFFTLFVSCSAISNQEIRDSVIGDMFKDPIVTISPDPSRPIVADSINSIISISNPGGIGRISLDVGGTNVEFDAQKATSYELTNLIQLSSSQLVPVSVLAYSAKTGNPSTQRYSYIFDLAGLSDPPSIVLTSPTNKATVGFGTLDIDLSILHSIAKVRRAVVSSAGVADQVFDFIDTPESTNITATFNIASGDEFKFSVTAESGIGKSQTKEFTYVVQSKPIISELSPDTATTTITTAQQIISATITSPAPTSTVQLFVDGAHVEDKTVSGSGDVTFVVDIPIKTSPPTGTLQIQLLASYAGSPNIATNISSYNIDHSALASAPTITIVQPTLPTTLLASAAGLTVAIADAEQTTVGVTNLRALLIKKGSIVTTNTGLPFVTRPVTPMEPTVRLSNILTFDTHQASGEDVSYTWEVTSVAANGRSSIKSAIYNAPTDFVDIRSVRLNDLILSFDVNISRSSASGREDTTSTIRQILVSTNVPGSSDVWVPAVMHGVRPDTAFSSNISLPISLTENMKIRVSSAKTSGFITTNIYEVTNRPPSTAYAFDISPSISGSIPANTDFPFSFKVHSSLPINQIKLKGTGGGVITPPINPSSSITTYQFNDKINLGSSFGSRGVTIEVTAGGITQSTNITYSSVARDSRYFFSLSRDNQVLTSPNFDLVITNWDGGTAAISMANQNIQHIAGTITNSLGNFGKDLAPGDTATKAITLSQGRNIIRFTATGTGAVPTITTNINVYYADTTLD